MQACIKTKEKASLSNSRVPTLQEYSICEEREKIRRKAPVLFLLGIELAGVAMNEVELQSRTRMRLREREREREREKGDAMCASASCTSWKASFAIACLVCRLSLTLACCVSCSLSLSHSRMCGVCVCVESSVLWASQALPGAGLL